MQKNIISHLLQLLFIGGLVASCNKPREVELANEGVLYMPQAVSTRSKIDLQLSAKPFEIVFGAAYGGLKISDRENTVSFKIDSGLVADYNTKNGTNYKLLPRHTYNISGLDATISAGNTSSTPLTLTVSSSSVPFGTRYMLPITLASSAHSAINPELQTAYFRFDTILRKSIDITGQGTLSVSNENSGGSTAGEGSPKLVDGDINTKYLYSGFNPACWFELRMQSPVVLGAYTFTSANDAATRDPKTWTLKGSNDGTTWTTLDTRTDESFASRFQTKRYEIPGTPQAYTHYRVLLTANGGSSLFQMAEWRLFRYE